MELRKQAVPVVKLVVAALAVTALCSIPARQLAPALSLVELAALLLCAFVALTGIAIASLTIALFVLRSGGTDPQWLWFGGEPPGLERLRREQREEGRRES